MKRKLVDYNSFEKMQSESFTSVKAELDSAADLLAETLGLGDLTVNSYTAENVLFESDAGDFVKADYGVSNGYVQFDNIEQVVLNESAETEKARDVISKMIDSLVESDEAAAGERLDEWFAIPRNKRIISEAKVMRRVPKRKTVDGVTKIVGYERKPWEAGGKKKESGLNTKKRSMGKIKKNKKTTSAEKAKRKLMRSRIKFMDKSMKEWHVLAENVLGFVDYTVNGPELDACKVLRSGEDVVGVKVPTIKLRNEAKLLRFDWKTMNTDVVVKRNSGKKLAENNEFAQAVEELRKLNALSDSKAFEESVEKAATKFASVIYLTEGELATLVKGMLETNGSSNFDDETCVFLAEALLRTVHDNYVDTVSKIVKLAGGQINETAKDKYAEFKTIAEGLYARLDDQAELEIQAFVDVYEAIRNIHEAAKEDGDEGIATSAAGHLDGLLPIVAGKSEMDFETLGEAAEWLYNIVEANAPETWSTHEPVVRTDGEHPDLAKKGKHSQSPADMQGNTPEQQHVSDGKEVQGDAAKELAGDGWSNIGGEGVYPSLDNPYVPKADVPKIVGEKDVDSDSDQLAQWGDNDTWPSLQNPYVKQSVKPEMKE